MLIKLRRYTGYKYGIGPRGVFPRAYGTVTQRSYAVNELPHPHPPDAFGLLKVNPEP